MTERAGVGVKFFVKAVGLLERIHGEKTVGDGAEFEKFRAALEEAEKRYIALPDFSKKPKLRK